MIIGIGSDLIDIRRVAKVIERHGERFLDRIFTDAERARAGRREEAEVDANAALAIDPLIADAIPALGRLRIEWRTQGV